MEPVRTGRWPLTRPAIFTARPTATQRTLSPGPGQVTFTITDETNSPASTPAQVGSVCGFTSTSGCAQMATNAMVTTVAVSNANYAFAVLTSPPDFARSGVDTHQTDPQRLINVSANFAGDDGTTKVQSAALQLVRPPVVLLHGIWSSVGTWTWNILKDPRFLAYPLDYGPTAASRFSSQALCLGPGTVPSCMVFLNQPQTGIQKVLRVLRSRGIAATQADFLGHSMGGLLARLYASQYQGIAYLRDDNLQVGDIHKLITVDSPHNGSQLPIEILTPDNSAASTFGSVLMNVHLIGCVSPAGPRPIFGPAVSRCPTWAALTCRHTQWWGLAVRRCWPVGPCIPP